MKQKIKKFAIVTMVSALTLTSLASFNTSALSTSRTATLTNGYKHKLAITFSNSSAQSVFSISSGGPCTIKNYMECREYNSSGALVKTYTKTSPEAYATERSCSVSRSSSSNHLDKLSSWGTNKGYAAKTRVAGNTYFKAIEIGDYSIQTNILSP